LIKTNSEKLNHITKKSKVPKSSFGMKYNKIDKNITKSKITNPKKKLIKRSDNISTA